MVYLSMLCFVFIACGITTCLGNLLANHVNVSFGNLIERNVRISSNDFQIDHVVPAASSSSFRLEVRVGSNVTLFATESELGIPVALNGRKNISIQTIHNQFTNEIKITPITFRIMPKYSYNLVQDLEQNVILGFSLLRMKTSALGRFRQKYGGLLFNIPSSLEGDLPANQFCLKRPEECENGMTVGFKLRLQNDEDFEEYKQYIFATKAISAYYHQKQLIFTLTTQQPNKKWAIIFKDPPTNEWVYVVYTWHLSTGSQLYVNSVLVGENRSGQDIESPETETQGNVQEKFKNSIFLKEKQRLVIGKSIDNKHSIKKFYLASITILYKYVNKPTADQMMMYFWNKEFAQMYWAFMYIYNSQREPVTLLSEHGNIKLIPNAQTKILLRSFGDNGEMPEPIRFRATKDNSGERIEINKQIQPYEVPLEKAVMKKYQLIVGKYY